MVILQESREHYINLCLILRPILQSPSFIQSKSFNHKDLPPFNEIVKLTMDPHALSSSQLDPELRQQHNAARLPEPPSLPLVSRSRALADADILDGYDNTMLLANVATNLESSSSASWSYESLDLYRPANYQPCTDQLPYGRYQVPREPMYSCFQVDLPGQGPYSKFGSDVVGSTSHAASIYSSQALRASSSIESLGLSRHGLSSSSSSSSDEQEHEHEHEAVSDASWYPVATRRSNIPPQDTTPDIKIDNELPALIRLSKKRYADPDPDIKKRAQGRPFADSMIVSLNMADSLDDILSSYLNNKPHDLCTLKTFLVRFDKLKANVARPQSKHFEQIPGSRYDPDLYCIDRRNIYDGIKQLFDVDDFYFVQIIRPSSMQSVKVNRNASSLPIQKFVTIPMTEENKKEMTCKFIKQNVAYPRYKCHMRLFLVRGRCTESQWVYTNNIVMEQELFQIGHGTLVVPHNTTIQGPSNFMKWVVNRRKDRKQR